MAVTRRGMLQYTSKGREEENSKQVTMDVNNAGFETFKKLASQMFYEDRNAQR